MHARRAFERLAQVAHQRQALGAMRIGRGVVDRDRFLGAHRAEQGDFRATQQGARFAAVHRRERDADGGREIERELRFAIRLRQGFDETQCDVDRLAARGGRQEHRELVVGRTRDQAIARDRRDALRRIAPSGDR